MLPFEPEQVPQLRARYLAAVETVIECEAIANGKAPSAGTERAHVFDFEDGLRIIVSRDLFPDGRVGLHLTGSSIDGSLAWHLISLKTTSVDQFIALIVTRWGLISGESGDFELIGVTMPKGIPHLMKWELQAKPTEQVM